MDRKLSIFVISPIGQPGSKTRKEADAVLQNIIQPAADTLRGKPISHKYPHDGCFTEVECVRGERDPSARDIMVRIVDSIIQADLIVTLISEKNLNVFFELGIARSANSPVFLLKERRIEMPTDLRNFPYIEYRCQDVLRRREAAVKATRDELARMLASNLEEANKNPPFERQELGALGGPAILDRFMQVSYADWSRLILSSEREFWLCGLTLWELLRPQNTNFHLPKGPRAEIGNGDGDAHLTQLLQFLLATGADVTVMLMDPDNAALPHYAIRPLSEGGGDPSSAILAEIRNEIPQSIAALEARLAPPLVAEVQQRYGLGNPAGRWRLCLVRQGQIPMRVTLSDRACITSPFFHWITRSSGGPAIRALAGSAWHTAIKRDLELLISRQNSKMIWRGAA